MNVNVTHQFDCIVIKAFRQLLQLDLKMYQFFAIMGTS